ncbi:MAG: hypothetical protein WBM58_10950, partial [Sedimenticolaceae bacterium]
MASVKLDKQFAQTTESFKQLAAIRPEVLSSFRLEVDPRGESYDEALAARVADPLWMLGRQWQFR